MNETFFNKTIIFWDWLNTLIYEKEGAISKIPFAWHLVEEFHKIGFVQIIASNGQLQNITNFTDTSFFAEILTASDFPPKPDPTMILHALKKYEIKASNGYFIGDSEIDAETAKNSEINCFIVARLDIKSYMTVAEFFNIKFN